MLVRPPHQDETSTTFQGSVPDTCGPSPPEHRVTGHMRACPPSVRSRDGGHNASLMEETLRARHVVASLCHTVLDDVNTVLLQYTPDLLNILHIHASNADTALDLTVIVFNNFKFKRDAVQPENDLPAQ